MTIPNGPADDPLPEALTLVQSASEAGHRLRRTLDQRHGLRQRIIHRPVRCGHARSLLAVRAPMAHAIGAISIMVT